MGKLMSQEQIDEIKIHTDTMIKGMFNEYYWLSNYEVCEIHYEGLIYTSTEAAYQAAKSTDPFVRSKFINISPAKARKLGQEITCRKDWDKVKKQVMYDVNLYKYTKHEYLKNLLLETGDKEIVEENWWLDTFWGVCKGKGENNLGKILMKIRDEIRKDVA
jgi:ribA/ribD-fused uncharacterized protein